MLMYTCNPVSFKNFLFQEAASITNILKCISTSMCPYFKCHSLTVKAQHYWGHLWSKISNIEKIPVCVLHQQPRKLEGQCFQPFPSAYSYWWSQVKQQDRREIIIWCIRYMSSQLKSNKQDAYISCWFLQVTTIFACPQCSHCRTRARWLQYFRTDLS